MPTDTDEKIGLEDLPVMPDSPPDQNEEEEDDHDLSSHYRSFPFAF